jgi:hypothetical protein
MGQTSNRRKSLKDLIETACRKLTLTIKSLRFLFFIQIGTSPFFLGFKELLHFTLCETFVFQLERIQHRLKI